MQNNIFSYASIQRVTEDNKIVHNWANSIQMQSEIDAKTLFGTTKQEPEVAEIDAKIVDHFKAISELRRRRNLLAPSVSRLPPEILTYIFAFLVKENTFSWSWIVVTHVCTLWRQIALDTPELWSYINSFSRRDVETLLDRSKAADLSIQVSMPNFHAEQTASSYKLALQHLSRIREFEMYDVRCVNDKWLEMHSDVTAEALRLRRLCISVRDYMALPIPVLSVDCSKLIQSAPMLKNLSLSGCHISWSSCRLENLSELALESIRPEEKMPNIAEILNILASSPMLEKLVLAGVGPLEGSADSDFDVKMPNLRSLKLSQIKSHILIRLLHCLKFSHELDWDIECSNYPILNPQNACPIISAPKDKSSIIMKISLYVQKIVVESINDMDSHATKSSGRLSLSWQDRFDGVYYSQRISNALSVIIGSHFWNEAEDFEVSIWDAGICIHEEGWGVLLRAFGHLDSIACNFFVYDYDEESEIGLVNSLMQPVSPRSETVVRSDLNKLRLNLAHFSETENSLKDRLLECLKYRKEHGARTLTTLEICKGIGVNQEAIDELKPHVQELLWDGLDYAEEDEDDDDEYEDEYTDSFAVDTDDMFDSDNEYF